LPVERIRIVGVMGGGRAAARDAEAAYELGGLIAREGWVLLNGGRRAGIMQASAKGAAEHGGLTMGILPDDHGRGASEFIRIPVLTGMGSARNVINVLTSHVVVACPGGAGTISEIALALKYARTVILFNFDLGGLFQDYRTRGQLLQADTAAAVVEKIRAVFAGADPS
jgi:uncharacterized protein (TIGR00725 family)